MKIQPQGKMRKRHKKEKIRHGVCNVDLKCRHYVIYIWNRNLTAIKLGAWTSCRWVARLAFRGPEDQSTAWQKKPKIYNFNLLFIKIHVRLFAFAYKRITFLCRLTFCSGAILWRKIKTVFSLHFRGKFAISSFLAETKFTVVFERFCKTSPI